MSNLLRCRARRLVFLGVPMLAAAAIGCGHEPQVSDANREIVVSLATAVSTRNPDWIDSNARLIEKQRTDGQCSDAEYEAFQNIIAQTRAGDWEAAEAAAYALRDAQKPTAEDLENLSQRKLSGEHGLAKPKAGRPR